ncbi:AzlD domain-containing protein [Streptomyces sp. NPDC020917]|uniref:AzlD domain-containing protein n=1 Tax=Streptomyces sp. NPDC020917 TaxID=3365102 RepID=UPI0037B0DF8B
MRLALATVVLGAGTFGFRFAGPVLRARMRMSPRVERFVGVAVVVLLAALVATSTLTEGHHFTGPARPAGVAVGALLAWRRAPFALVVIAAAATTALLRLLALP